MGCYKIGDHIPGRKDTTNILHPRFVGDGIPPVNTFHAAMHERTARWIPDGEVWCVKEAWFAHLKGRERSMLTLSLTHCMHHRPTDHMEYSCHDEVTMD